MVVFLLIYAKICLVELSSHHYMIMHSTTPAYLIMFQMPSFVPSCISCCLLVVRVRRERRRRRGRQQEARLHHNLQLQ